MPGHLRSEERDRVAHLRSRGAAQKEIADALERAPSTISRELKRTGGLATLVDRKSRFTIVLKVRSKHADHVHQRLKERLKELDEERRHSITFDHGTELASCDRLEKHLGMKLYYADPGCPYQRGSNENTNGLIRQYFPKGTDFRDISHHQVRRVEKLLDDRPRACLGFRTPAEVFFEKKTAHRLRLSLETAGTVEVFVRALFHACLSSLAPLS